MEYNQLFKFFLDISFDSGVSMKAFIWLIRSICISLSVYFKIKQLSSLNFSVRPQKKTNRRCQFPIWGDLVAVCCPLSLTV